MPFRRTSTTSGSIGASLCPTAGARPRHKSVATLKKPLAASVMRRHRADMARKRRDKAAGLFHVYTHSVWSAELFRDDRDRVVFLRELAGAIDKAEWTCVGFCLMKTHDHFVLDVDDDALPLGMHALSFRFAVEFNRRHRMKGHVLGARYDAVRIRDGTHLLDAYRYVARNPVEAGMCEAAEDWRWS